MNFPSIKHCLARLIRRFTTRQINIYLLLIGRLWNDASLLLPVYILPRLVANPRAMSIIINN